MMFGIGEPDKDDTQFPPGTQYGRHRYL